MVEHLWMLVLAVGVVAFLYSSVGHAGASGYIAVMGLASLSPALIKPTALLLNVIVAGIGTLQFLRAGHFRWRLFWPFALLSVPLALKNAFCGQNAVISRQRSGIGTSPSGNACGGGARTAPGLSCVTASGSGAT